MEHLPLPNDPILKILDIPLLCIEEYDSGPFFSYPERRGWVLERYARRCTFSHQHEVVADAQQIGAFLQTWLYFGLLHELTGTIIDHDDFRRTEDGRNYLCSSKLESIVADLSRTLYENGLNMTEEDFAQKLDHYESCLQYASDVMYAVVAQEEKEGHLTSPLMLICLGIGTLGEYLTDVLERVVGELKFQRPAISVTWRNSRVSDSGKCLIYFMEQHGWCSRFLTQFEVENVEFQLIGRLWFFANMKPPLAHLAHDQCSREVCRHQQMDEATYKTLHLAQECNCEFVGPDPVAIAQLVSSGRTPLVRLTPDFQLEVVAMDDELAVYRSFVAISHVWADGRGNQDDNTLPLCVLIDIQRCVDEAVHPEADSVFSEPFWIDTLCLPRYPVELRKKSMLMLNEPFQRADRTLILETYLRGCELETMSEIEILARISICQWTSRLWTFPEGRFAKELWIQFGDKAIDLHETISSYYGHFEPVPTMASAHVFYAIMETYKATQVRRGLDDYGRIVGDKNSPPPLIALRSALRTRATSKAADEAICLSQILRLDLRKVVYSNRSEKMATFWAAIERVPLGLAFSRATQKLSSKGYHWAPASLMGDLECKQLAWAGPPALLESLDATPTDNGLLVVLSALTFVAGGRNNLAKRSMLKRCFMEMELMSHLELRDNAGNWYKCDIDQQWHQNRPVSAPCDGELAILLQSSFTELNGSISGSQPVRMLQGLMVNAKELNQPVNHVQVHAHVSVRRSTPLEQEWNQCLEQCAKVVFDTIDEDDDNLSDPEILRLTLSLAIEDYAAEDPRIYDLGKQILPYAADDNDLVESVCLDWIMYFLEIGKWYIVQETLSPLS